MDARLPPFSYTISHSLRWLLPSFSMHSLEQHASPHTAHSGVPQFAPTCTNRIAVAERFVFSPHAGVEKSCDRIANPTRCTHS